MKFILPILFFLTFTLLTLSPILWLTFSLITQKKYRRFAAVASSVWFLLLLAPMFFESQMISLPRLIIIILAFMASLYISLLLLQIFRFLLLLLAKLLSLIHIKAFEVLIRSRTCSIFLLFFGLLLTSYGFYEAIKTPTVKNVTIPIANLDPQLEGYKILQLTDLHVGLILNSTWLEKVVLKSNEQKPDLIVVTGDFAEFPPSVLGEESPFALKDLYAPDGVYFVLGNHEYYGNLAEWLDFFKKNELNLLYDTYMLAPSVPLLIAGTRGAPHFKDFQVNYEILFKNAPQGLRILLSHFPAEIKYASQNNVDLQISGHTHGGTFFFLKSIVAAANGGFVSGLYEVGESLLYVNNGTGLWTPTPLRLGVPSEITILQLVRE